MGLRDRVRRLQKLTAEPADVLILKDSQEVKLAPGERLEAFQCLFSGEDHPLLAILDEIDLEATPEAREFVEFVQAYSAINGSWTPLTPSFY